MNGNSFEKQKEPGRLPLGVIALDRVPWLFECKSLAAVKLLLSLLRVANPRTGEVHLTSGMRAEMVQALHISKATFHNAMNHLEEVGAIRKMTYLDRKTGMRVGSHTDFMLDMSSFRCRWEGERRWNNKLR